ncbi:hypothetical protein J1792_19115 [Streptomyces triculaminicus]|uniref:Uncharacterized protein n=1 Tax=Streptomyces triculaminicus TaxID=2816232 RepID=A0A939JPR8_9ACTN|nr:hypothetical protein [Streptomyces triculaminicus]MBO0654808.1 hypothetical protein [Streptomyces triculaminicus]
MADKQSIAGAPIAAEANAKTKAIAAANPAATQAAATVCGSSYKLIHAERLPERAIRWGTLFAFSNGGVGPNDTICAIFDNNTDVARHMKLQICNNSTSPRCQTDEGVFKQYAGPVRMDDCPVITAVMLTADGSMAINARRDFCR